MRELKKSLCLIVWNEVEGCKADVPNINRNVFHEVYAVDGGSTDGTQEYLAAQGIPVYRQPKRSLNAAYRHAVEKCSTDAVVVFFPKNTIDPVCLESFVRLLDAGYDYVVASRNLPGSRNEEDSGWWRPRKWGVAALSRTAAMLWKREGTRVTDILHGVKAFTIESYRKMNVSETGVTIDLEMAVRSYRQRIPRAEFPVRETSRSYGETKFRIWPTAKQLAGWLVRELIR
jgi:glycosyltransferase involved in cell wall biosynthesis